MQGAIASQFRSTSDARCPRSARAGRYRRRPARCGHRRKWSFADRCPAERRALARHENEALDLAGSPRSEKVGDSLRIRRARHGAVVDEFGLAITTVDARPGRTAAVEHQNVESGAVSPWSR